MTAITAIPFRSASSVKISGKFFSARGKRIFAHDSRRFNLAFTISRYNSAIDGGNAHSATLPMSKRGGQGKQQP
jgi:hypothetical protein